MGSAFAEALVERGHNVALLARRPVVLDQVAANIRQRHGVETRTLAIDLAHPGAAAQIMSGVSDLEAGFFAYCAGADPNYQPFLTNPLEAAESMVHRNCTVPMQLCHLLAGPMVERGRGDSVITQPSLLNQ